MKRGWSIPLLLVGCTGSVVATDPTASTGADSSDASETSSAASSSDSTSSSSSGAADGSSSSTSTGEVLDGPGCGVIPECGAPSSVGVSVGVHSAEDLAALEGVEEIFGTLEISDSDLECLDALSCLRVVGGDVRIQGNAALRSTAGLRNVEELGSSDLSNTPGAVVVADNEALETLEGFDRVRRIRSGVTLWQNPALRDVAAFSGLRDLGALSINSNPTLESLSGLHDLEELRRCDVNQNASLCISEVFEVCGDLQELPGGITDNNDDGC